MLVGERMTHNPITIRPDTSIDEALRIIRENKVRRLPVLDRNKNLVGIVSEKDLLYASPSPVTTLSVFELHYLLSKLTVAEIMKRDVITTCETCPLEEAARLMVDNKIGCLPVMRDGKLVGIITETDIFKILIELLGAREQGVRLTVLAPDQKGQLAALTAAIAQTGGNIVSLSTFLGQDPTNRLITVKVQDVPPEKLTAVAEELGAKVVDVR